MAQIYGVLYCSDQPMMQDEVAQKLGASVGSVSQGLKLLSTIGAVNRHSIPGQRQSHYAAERSMRRLLGYFLDAQIRPKLNSGRHRLEAIQQTVPKDDKSAQQKIKSLLEWQQKADKALPMIITLFGK